jgi:CubicO group peptidase (beta-lactamase class C family)
VPEFAEPVVAVSRKEGEKVVWNTEKAKRAITIHDLLTHTSGISYRFFNRPYLGERFVKAGVSDGVSETEGTIGDNVKRIAQVPLFLQPGSGFEYGLNTDVLGRVIEVASGQTLDAFLRERVFTPLKMNDTYFHLPKEKRSRLASLYEPAPEKGLRKIGDKRKIVALLEFTSTYPTSDTSKYYSGGGGLVSTTHDYQRFLQMMLRGGELDGARILKATTVKQMTSNQLGEVKFAPGPFGNSFGYGFGIERRKDAKLPAGSFAWGGLFHTFFWADPGNEIAAVLMTQLYPSNRVKLNEEFVTKVYAKTPE